MWAIPSVARCVVVALPFRYAGLLGPTIIICPMPTSVSNLRHTDVLELHVAHACNLTCESCTHYSNHGHRGVVSVDDADAWMGAWSSRVAPQRFKLLGGEPTIHPDLPAFVPLVRKHWPAATINIATNGFFLHKHPELPAVLAADGHAELSLSVHHASPEYAARLQPVLDLLSAWQKKHSFTMRINKSADRWTRFYHGYGASMQPFQDGRPEESWQVCMTRHSKQLFEAKLWKCPPLAYLKLQKAQFDLSEQWNRYLEYRPLEPHCSDSELDAFLAKKGETYCSMCPAEPQPFSLPLPMRLPSNTLGASRPDPTTLGQAP